jgi:hypothetical protein
MAALGYGSTSDRDWTFVRRLLQTGCIFLLLFAQQVALTHLLWHAQRSARVERIDRSVAETKQPAKAPHLAALCAFHALLGQVLGAASCDARTHERTFSTGEPPQHLARELVHPDFLAPLSRGPPSSLVS